MPAEAHADDLVFEALTWLVRHEASVRDDYGERAELTREAVEQQSTWSAATEEVLQVLLAENPDYGDFHAMGSWLYLPKLPRGRGRIPLLNAIYDRRQAPMRLSLQVAVFWLGDELDLCADGWRFESPEAPGQDAISEHAYYHAQPCRALRTGRGDITIGLPPAMDSADVPTFPLDASDALSLLVAMLISFYGRHEGARLLQLVGLPALKATMQSMRGMHPPYSLD